MDKTEIYIKQCANAEEVQEGTIKDEDYIVVTDGSNLRIYEGLAGFHQGPFHSPSPVTITRIFRQDQLQEMWALDSIPNVLENFFDFCFEYGESDHDFNEYPKQFQSMEQLWLAFVMSKLYNKTWDGDKWIST